MDNKVNLIDCTLRDGGYYNSWDFSRELIVEYLIAMKAASVDYVELGFRSFDTAGFRGAIAYTTDKFIKSLPIPEGLKIGVMMNASELVAHPLGPIDAVNKLFVKAEHSPVKLVRFACHIHEFEAILPVCSHLKKIGYQVGINLMQVADRSKVEIENIGKSASNYPLDVLYFADSLGGLNPDQVAAIVSMLRLHWKGDLGIHTHDNMGSAVANTFRAVDEGVSWIDSTVTGMGRGPGNAQTEYVLLEMARRNGQLSNLTPLLSLIRRYFKPMQAHYGWGSNPYYYLAGQYGIHPTYVQEMLSDPRYGETEILSVIEHLRVVGGKKFSSLTMEDGRQMSGGDASGSWAPASVMHGREVLILGVGPGVVAHREGLQHLIRERKLFVIALNTQTSIDAELIDMRAACHPFRLLADCETYRTLPQPLALPEARLLGEVRESFSTVTKFDFGLTIKPGVFEFHEKFAVTPSSLVVAYALAMATSGKASRILLAGFDGFGADDPRTVEMVELLTTYQAAAGALAVVSITPTRYNIPSSSVYAL
jgi:4-hydroxy 2-oxovalerate aldolase